MVCPCLIVQSGAKPILHITEIISVACSLGWELMGNQLLEPTELSLRTIQSLQLPASPTLPHLISAVERAYGKPLEFDEVPDEVLAEGVTGRWVDMPDRGIIQYRRGHAFWCRHVILHEFGHILLGHKGEPADGLQSAGFFSGVGKRRGISWMCRPAAIPLEEVEQAAENLAYALAQRLVTGQDACVSDAERIFGL